jgi:hypothetical protein
MKSLVKRFWDQGDIRRSFEEKKEIQSPKRVKSALLFGWKGWRGQI